MRLLRRCAEDGPAGRSWARLPMLGLLVAAAAACAGSALPAAAWADASAASSTSAAGAATTRTPESTRNTKVALLKALTAAPDTMVFGSSRAMRVNPADYQTYTGRTAFNASVSSGTIADAYCLAHYVRDLFPGTTQRYLWLLDVEQFRHSRVHRSVYAQPELAQYIPAAFPSPYTASSTSTTRAASTSSTPTVSTATSSATPTPTYGPVDVFDANGWLVWNRYDYYRARSRTLSKGLAYSRWKARQVYPHGYGSMKGAPKWFCAETIRLMNEWGATPVIVLTPYQPKLYTYISERGYTKRHDDVVAYFKALKKLGFRFVLLDYTQIKSFGGWASGFYDGTHMRAALSKMLLYRAVVSSGGVL